MQFFVDNKYILHTVKLELIKLFMLYSPQERNR